MTTGFLQVLLVEDNPADVDLARDALETSNLPLEISVATDGIEALEFLQGRGRYIGASRPDLILLDLNLPRKNGKELLAEIKLDKDLKRIPIVILSSSEAEKDVTQSYDLGANCYVTKPVDLKVFQAIVRGIEEFWFSIVKLPPRVQG